jgi:hypothetical protein
MKTPFALTAIVLGIAWLMLAHSAMAQNPTTPATDAPVTGEDLELGPQKSALARLRDKLKRASNLLAEKRTDNAVIDLQFEIETDLQDLLRQTGGSSSQASGNAVQQSTGESNGDNRPDTTHANNAEKNGSSSKNGATAVNRNPLKSLVRDSWGNLPERARQELQSVSGEDFLPKYQRMIERYYRRLADEASRKKRESQGGESTGRESPTGDKRP